VENGEVETGGEMRVIAGSLRSRILAAPEGTDTRPTSDRLRETLFNVLTQGAADRVVGAHVLDLYAGSGAVGIEALSRGAASVTFVEQAPGALAILRKNLDSLGVRSGFAVERRSVGRFLRETVEKGGVGRFGLVFLDPPYDAAEEYATTLGLLGDDSASLLSHDAWVVAEHRRKAALPERYGALGRFRVKEQGDAGLSFYEVKPEEQGV
jgi:16S rRNA (guanine966-N2)-methyltransferase